MKIVRKIALGLIVVLVLLVSVSFFLPSELHVERSTRIRTSKADAFRVLHNLRRFSEWSPWYKQDPDATYTFAGPEEGGVGSEITWDSEVTEQGKMVIARTVPYDSIFIEIYFGEDHSSSGITSFDLSEASADSVKISWNFRIDMGMNPLARYISLFMRGMIATQYEIGLQDLKILLERQPPVTDAEVELLELEAQQIVGLRGRFDSTQEAGPSMEQSFAALMKYFPQSSDSLSYATVYIGAPDEHGGMNYIAGYLSNADQLRP